ncbi:hypothetical protein PENSTE_c038G09434 [Penicillium steckii]|uniref:Carboxylic ester hydrolase n=1 Tax=Penicillium steckii TaxID=303698 RepID=A0A1V6SKA1_9EURO|nr:hypothetical protein PENSTE_c038G09434 [Penicillium steckii]
MQAFEFNHPSLGVIRGLTSESTNQFLGLQYATLEGKFEQPQLRAGSSVLINATGFGPSVPSPSYGFDMESNHIQRGLQKQDLTQSDTECLNLNITLPSNNTSSSKLPVMVFLHGGGFAIGSNFWQQYDLQRFVELSKENQTPLICVTVNYRLGLFGFLTSDEFVSHGKSPNNGLRDQRTALLWIKKYVAGFGGGPDNLTVVGQSAGGVSATIHLDSEVPLFKRLVSMGGTNLLMPPLAPQVANSVYDQIVDRLGLSELSPSERVKSITQTPIYRLMSIVRPTDALRPVIDSLGWVKRHSYAETYRGMSGMPGRSWCPEILIGDCQMDVSHDATTFQASLTQSLKSAEAAKKVMDAYGITENLEREEAILRILNFGNDIGFFIPIVNYGHMWSGNAYLYHFNQPNTWSGPWKGYANHILDVTYLFQNYNDHLTPEQRKVSTQFAKDIISFANSKAPWPAFYPEDSKRHTRVYGGKGLGDSNSIETVIAPSPRAQRRGTIFDLQVSIDSDSLVLAWGMFLAGL